MRKVILFLSISLDGFMSGPNGELDWQLVDDEVHRHFNAELRQMSAFLTGRVTHELMAGFWPTADSDASSPPPMVEFAGIWREMPKMVFSRTLPAGPREWNTTVVPEVVPDQINALKAEPGGDMVIGGADLAASFLRDNLIDELRLYVHPVLIGAGKPVFPPLDSRLSLKTIETRTFSNGVVLLRYERLNS